MKTIKESILSSTGSGKMLANKTLAKKFAKKHNDLKKYIVEEDRFDCYGNKLEIGDLVFHNGAFNTCPVEVLVISSFTSPLKKDSKAAITCYNPYTDKEERIMLFEIAKVMKPEEYLK